jgi:hypothetical protein
VDAGGWPGANADHADHALPCAATRGAAHRKPHPTTWPQRVEGMLTGRLMPTATTRPRYQSTKRAEGKRKLAQRVQALTVEGLSIRLIHQRLGISERYVSELRKLAEENGVGEVRYYPEARPLSAITDPEVLACLENTPEGLERFFNRYSGHILAPHSKRFVQAAYHYAGPCSTCEKQAPYQLEGRLTCDRHAHDGLTLLAGVELVGLWKPLVLICVPPDHAKTSVFSVFMSLWRTARNRNIRILLVSDTADMSIELAGEIAANMEGNELLIQDLGRLRPEGGNVPWQPGKGNLRVEGSTLTRGFNIRSRGAGQQVLGFRADVVIVDDLCNPENQETHERRAKLASWFANVVLSRLEPDGPCIVIGTRQHLHDLYAELAGKTVVEGDRESESLWEHINFPAVADPLTGEASLDFENGVALWPEKWPLAALKRRYASLGSSAFARTYQQQPFGPEEQLVREEWIEGSDYDSDPRRGCLDRDRIAGPIPKLSDAVRVVSLDPTQTQYAGIVVADVDIVDLTNFSATVLELVKKKLDVRGTIAELDRLCAIYRPTWLVFEINLARHLRENPEFLALKTRYGVRMKEHSTQRNKADPQLGIESVAIDFELGRIRLPYGDVESRSQTIALKAEATQYPHGRSDDLLMALWFVKWNYRGLRLPRILGPQRETGWGRVPAGMTAERW